MRTAGIKEMRPFWRHIILSTKLNMCRYAHSWQKRLLRNLEATKFDLICKTQTQAERTQVSEASRHWLLSLLIPPFLGTKDSKSLKPLAFALGLIEEEDPNTVEADPRMSVGM
jgi:hypothetical protein